MKLLRRLTTVTALILSLFLSAVLPDLAMAQEASAQRVEVGAYVLRLSNVSQKDGTFDVDMWLWFRWTDPALKPYEGFEVSNGRIASRSEAVVSHDGDHLYTSVRVQATVFHDYDVSRYPLDSHVLTIDIEDENLGADSLVYVADANTAIDPDLSVPGWNVKLDAPKIEAHEYPTNYGLKFSGQTSSSYSRAVFQVELLRSDFGPLFKQFWISALSVILGLLAFRVRATDLDARFGLGVGSIFAASANAFVIADSLPQSTEITLAEQINFLSVGTIFLCVAVSVWSLRICYRGRDAASEKLDLWAMVVIAMGYLAANAVIVGMNL